MAQYSIISIFCKLLGKIYVQEPLQEHDSHKITDAIICALERSTCRIKEV